MHPIGTQCFSYRNFSLEEVCDQLRGSDVSALELMGTHVDPANGAGEIDRVRSILGEAGIDPCGYYGVPEAGSIEAGVKFAQALGAGYINVDTPPEESTELNNIIEVAGDAGIDIAIHNHGPGANYESLEDVTEILDGKPEHVGACVDVGHFMRVDEHPEDVIPVLGERIKVVHIKDFIDADTEVAPGAGNLDMAELLELLEEYADITHPLIIEYEAEPEDPTPVVRKTAETLQELQR